MAVTDYDTVAANNTSINGVSIAEGWPPANVNNAFRELLADIASGIDNGDFANVAGSQPLDATLTALAGLSTGADRIAYSTGTDTFAETDITAYGRTLLALADVAALKSTLGSVTVTSSTFAPDGHIAFDITGSGVPNIQLCWGTGRFGTAETFETAFPNICWAVIPFPTSLISQGDEADEHMYLTSVSRTGFNATFSGDWNSPLPTFNYIAIGN